ncbi:hypothetical protein RIF29_15145 [Crotalaria pallida]|uniref:Uncharacterized protein n=1 Tax=Crotalaria pallida TaxID=3830 RepID=A0AAN9IDC7_CROPI
MIITEEDRSRRSPPPVYPLHFPRCEVDDFFPLVHVIFFYLSLLFSVLYDESTAGERPSRVSLWEIEPVVSPFYICPPPFLRSKFPRQPGMPEDESDIENAFKRAMPWLGEDFGMKDASNSIFPGLDQLP